MTPLVGREAEVAAVAARRGDAGAPTGSAARWASVASRTVLRLSGERDFPVPPLSLPDEAAARIGHLSPDATLAPSTGPAPSGCRRRSRPRPPRRRRRAPVAVVGGAQDALLLGDRDFDLGRDRLARLGELGRPLVVAAQQSNPLANEGRGAFPAAFVGERPVRPRRVDHRPTPEPWKRNAAMPTTRQMADAAGQGALADATGRHGFAHSSSPEPVPYSSPPSSAAASS